VAPPFLFDAHPPPPFSIAWPLFSPFFAPQSFLFPVLTEKGFFSLALRHGTTLICSVVLFSRRTEERLRQSSFFFSEKSPFLFSFFFTLRSLRMDGKGFSFPERFFLVETRAPSSLPDYLFTEGFSLSVLPPGVCVDLSFSSRRSHRSKRALHLSFPATLRIFSPGTSQPSSTILPSFPLLPPPLRDGADFPPPLFSSRRRRVAGESFFFFLMNSENDHLFFRRLCPSFPFSPWAVSTSLVLPVVSARWFALFFCDADRRPRRRYVVEPPCVLFRSVPQ